MSFPTNLNETRKFVKRASNAKLQEFIRSLVEIGYKKAIHEMQDKVAEQKHLIKKAEQNVNDEVQGTEE